MGTVSSESGLPPDSSFLPDSANGCNSHPELWHPCARLPPCYSKRYSQLGNDGLATAITLLHTRASYIPPAVGVQGPLPI